MQRFVFLAGFLAMSTLSTFAADPAASDKAKLIANLEKTLTGCKMVGKFTTEGKEKDPATDEYTLNSAKKLEEGDLWLINAKMKDASIPVPVEIIWSGDTPIITLTNVTIPGLGAGFSCRILIYDKLYAGTWGHGEVTGHMWGKIVPAEKK